MMLYSIRYVFFIFILFTSLIFSGRVEAEELVLGNIDAKVTLIEYSSLSCPICARFHKDSLPLLKSKYIDTGEVRYIYRDFPLGSRALIASAISRCVSADKRLALLDLLYAKQGSWGNLDLDTNEAFYRVLRFAGFSLDKIADCGSDEAVIKAVLAQRAEAIKEYNIRGTPSFVINGNLYNVRSDFNSLDKVLSGLIE